MGSRAQGLDEERDASPTQTGGLGKVKNSGQKTEKEVGASIILAFRGKVNCWEDDPER